MQMKPCAAMLRHDLCFGFLIAIQIRMEEVNHLVSMVCHSAKAIVGVPNVLACNIAKPRSGFIQRDRNEITCHELRQVRLLRFRDS